MASNNSKNSVFTHLLALAITIAVWLPFDYFLLPPYNIQALETWYLAAALLTVFAVLDFILCAASGSKQKVEWEEAGWQENENAANNSGKGLAAWLRRILSGKKNRGNAPKKSLFRRLINNKRSVAFLALLAAAVLVIISLLLNFFSSPVFFSRHYARIAADQIETRDFIADTPESETIADIALMDTESARIIGSRALGSLSELVSQFEISDEYSQINLKSEPMKVAPLKYASLIKWLANRKEGIPGYVQVDPVANTSKYIELEQPMLYSDSACFGKYLQRKLRFASRTAIFGKVYFEIADDGTPYYVAPVLKHTVLFFGATDMKGVLTLNPCTGETQYYDISEVPSWIDIVYDGDMMTQRYDWYGLYSGGFLNSVLANKDCKRCTDDFGYKMFDDDVWIFTGVTSIVNDESNIGFVLMNARTAEIRYYAIPGAEEYSVMASAEGEVQNLGYTASFPSVINISGEPTYIMVLKDKGSLVKQYALVHVERYNIVITATSQKEAIAKYKAALTNVGIAEEDKSGEEEAAEQQITVKEIRYLVQEGNSYAYIISSEGDIFRMAVSTDERIVLAAAGDKISVLASPVTDGIFEVYSFEFAADKGSAGE